MRRKHERLPHCSFLNDPVRLLFILAAPLTCMTDVVVITLEELKELIDARGEYVLVDVREKDELVHGMIPTAQHLPLSQLKEAVSLAPTVFFSRYGFILPKDEQVIVYCRSGSRSGKAASYLCSLGYPAKNFKGSVLAWSEIDPKVKKH